MQRIVENRFNMNFNQPVEMHNDFAPARFADQEEDPPTNSGF